MLEAHPLADLFPMMSARERGDLERDLAANGLTDTIVTFEGKILDGRNRYAACLALGLTPHTRAYAGRDPLAFVLSKNLHRRHLDESQRAMVAAKIANMTRGGDRRSDQTANLQSDRKNAAITQASAAALLNVSERSVASAKFVREHGAPELVDAVAAGGISVASAETIADLPRAEQDEIVARGPDEIKRKAKEIRAAEGVARRAERLARIGHLADESARLPAGRKYPIVYADPPWRFAAGDSDRSVENHYPTMTAAQIAALPIGDLAGGDALLLLWATAPHLVGALDCLAAWGFGYKSHLCWDKVDVGTGYWFRNQHELLIVATRGDFPAPAPGTQLASVWREKRGAHSAKPAGVAAWIERCWPDLPKLELFCRDPRPGWSVWGNQAQGKAA